MKKTIATAVITAVTTAAIAVGCFAGCAKKNDNKQTASAYLDQDGNTIETTVDLSDGYSCDFVRGAVYLYDQEDKEDVEAVALGITLEEEVYSDYLKAAEKDTNKREFNGGLMFQEDNTMIYITKVSTDSYFGVFAENATSAQMEKYVSRFTVAPEF